MQEINRVGIFERLRHSIQLLACSAQIQLGMLPTFVCPADELVLDYDHWMNVTLENFRAELTSQQFSSLDAIARILSDLVKLGRENWTDEAVRESADWKRVREAAGAALESFGWPLEAPPGHTNEFVGGR